MAALLQSQVQGGLRISTSVAFGRRVLVPLVMRFMQLNPKLQIELSFEDRYVDLVEQGIDVAIRMGRLADSTLGARYLGINPWVVVASPDYLARRGTPRHAGRPGRPRCAGLQHRAGRCALAVHRARRAAAADRRCAARCARTTCRRCWRRRAAAWAWRPCRGTWRTSRCKARRGAAGADRLALPSQEIHAVYPSPRLVPAKVSGFIDWLQQQLGDAWWTQTG